MTKYTLQKEGDFKFIEEGEGPVLLLLHGLFGALSNWETVLDCFTKKYKVVIPLMPIYEMPLASTNVDGLSDFVHNFVTFKGYPPFTLIGNSLGGHVALVYTLDHPDMVHSMILTGSSGLYENSMGGSYPKRSNYEYIKQRTEFTFYKPETASKELVDEVFEIVNSRNKGLRVIMMAKSAIRHNLSHAIKNITIPTCLIWGLEDMVTPKEVGEEFNQLIPNSELHFISECGHAPMMEQPEAFNKIMSDFLDKIHVTYNTH